MEKKYYRTCTLLQPEAVAYWYLDDGGPGGNSRYGCVLDLSNWSWEERFPIQSAFLKLYGIETSFHGKQKSVKLFFRRKTIDRFFSQSIYQSDR